MAPDTGKSQQTVEVNQLESFRKNPRPCILPLFCCGSFPMSSTSAGFGRPHIMWVKPQELPTESLPVPTRTIEIPHQVSSFEDSSYPWDFFVTLQRFKIAENPPCLFPEFSPLGSMSMKLPDGISHFFQVNPHQVTICPA